MTQSKIYGAQAVQYAAIFFGCLNVINSGMVYGWPSASLPQLLHSGKMCLTHLEGMSIAIAPLLGSILASPLSCIITDTVGPKRTLMYTFYPYIFSWILIASSKNFGLLLLGRLVSGIGDGALFSSFSVYISDIYEKNSKFKLFSLFPICFSFGILLINILESISSILISASIAGALTSLSFCGMLIMPESPYYYSMKEKTYQAKEAMRCIRERDDVDEALRKLQSDSVYKDLTLQEIIKMISGRLFTTSLILASAQQVCGISAIIFFVTTILKDSKIQYYFDAEISIILFFLLLSITIFSTCIFEYRESRNILLCSTLGTVITLVINGLYFQFVNSKTDNSLMSLIPIATLMIYIICYGLGLNNLPFILLNECFPRYALSAILGIIHVFSNLMAIMICIIFTTFNDSYRIYVAFYCFAGGSVICFLLILFFVPKTQIPSEETISLIDSSEKEAAKTYYFMNGSFEISDYSD
ncbi:hypothetical protein WA026_000997 [Henosepilachna vigintioctopunctata]|uniref:Major facilitator superfamily (MFS) profile domain-containing protein n=1 Tax=Henosepilachna vigintioctopunctata TaxID=420089 RepID=A0AAW1V9S1_9CUCU